MKTSQLAKDTVSGVMWNYATFSFSKLLVFATTVILARYLYPEDFGLMAMALVIINYLTSLQSFGVDEALIFHQQDVYKTADTAFMISFSLGIILTAATFFSAPLFAVFFKEPRVCEIVQVLSLWFFIVNLGGTHEALMRKSLDFKRRLIPQIVQRTLKGIVSIILALIGYGVWSLVWGQLAGLAAATTLYWVISTWRPRFTFSIQIIKKLLSYGSKNAFLKLTQGVTRNIDYLIIGYRMGALDLGFYSIGFKVPEILIEGIQSAIMPAVFPAYARLNQKKSTLRKGFLTTIKFISLVSLPMSLGLYIISSDFIALFYTERWNSAVPVMQALCIYVYLNSFDSQANTIYMATNNMGIANKIGGAKLILTIPLLWLAAGYGISAVAITQIWIALVVNIVQLSVVCRILHITPFQLIRNLRPSFSASLVMLTGLVLLNNAMVFSSWVRLLISICSGIFLYTGTLFLIHREIFNEMINFLFERKRA